MKIDCEATALTVMAGALGIVAAVMLSGPTALADPPPVPEPAPAPAPAPPPAPPLLPWLVPPAAPVAAPADPAIPPPAPPPGPAPEGTVQAAAGDPAAPVPHLPSPEHLPPGTTDTPVTPQGGSYLRDLWHAYQTQEISGRDALLLLTQRPMDPNAVPPPGMAANPTPPLPPAPPPLEAAPAPPPAP